MFTKKQRSTFPYWFAHWCAYQMTALNIGAWKFKYLFHDLEKPFLKLFLPYKTVQQYHRKAHKHHPEWLENELYYYDYRNGGEAGIVNLLDEFDWEGMIIDWECSRFTKIAQPRNAYQEYLYLIEPISFREKYPHISMYCYHEFSKRALDTIKKLNLKEEK